MQPRGSSGSTPLPLAETLSEVTAEQAVVSSTELCVGVLSAMWLGMGSPELQFLGVFALSVGIALVAGILITEILSGVSSR